MSYFNLALEKMSIVYTPVKNVCFIAVEKGFSPLGARMITLLNTLGAHIPLNGAPFRGFPSYQALIGIVALVAISKTLNRAGTLAFHFMKTAQIDKKEHGTTTQEVVKRAIGLALIASSVALAYFASFHLFQGARAVVSALRV